MIRRQERRGQRKKSVARLHTSIRGMIAGEATAVAILLGSTPEERHFLEMVHAQHFSYAEIARRLGVAEGTIKARVFRCRDRLLAVRRQLPEDRRAKTAPPTDTPDRTG